MRGSLLLASFVAGVLACTPRAPVRPFGLPSTAAWAGGADGGFWIDCWRVSDVLRAQGTAASQIDAALDASFDCSLWDERGAIQKKGRFRLLDAGAGAQLKPAREPRRVMRYDGYDGCRILLDGARVLTIEANVACATDVCTDKC